MNLFCKHWKIVSVLSLAMLISGCLSNGDSNPATAAPTLGGTAATGNPIVGASVTVKCAVGSATSPQTGIDGKWSVSATGFMFPCAVDVSGGNLPSGQVYHSVALQAGTANITPLTDLIVANLAGQAPAIWFASLSSNAFQRITTNSVNTALANVRSALSLGALNGVDPLTVTFTAASGNAHDDILEALKLALTTASTTYPNLLNTAQNTTITPPAGFTTALTTNHQRFMTPAPTISTFSPVSGSASTTVTITGTNFDPDPLHMLVTFADNVPATVVSATTTQLVVTVPAGAATGTIKVTNGLTTHNVTSSSSFTVTTSGGGSSVGGTASWTQRSSGSSYILNTVAYGNGLFVAGGNGNTIITSPDGITWTSRSNTTAPLPDNGYFTVNNILWSSALNRFIAVGDRGTSVTGTPLLSTSLDGITWTRQNWTNSLSVANLWDIAADSTRVTVVGEKNILVSTDGITWSNQTINNIGGMSLTGIASSGAIRVAVGTYNSSNGLILVSIDGTTWGSVTTPASFIPQDVAWNGNIFVAVGSSAPLQFGATPAIATSTDGQIWTLRSTPSGVTSAVLYDITWDGARFIAVGSPFALADNRLFLTSSDGVSWAVDAQLTTGSGQKIPNGVISSGTRAVAVGDTVFTKDF